MNSVSVIDRKAVGAVAKEATLIREQMLKSANSDPVLDAVTNFQLALAAQALVTLDIAARELLNNDVMVAHMASFQIKAGASNSTADALKAGNVLMATLQSTYDKVLETKNLSPDVRVRKMADVVISAARNLYDQVEAYRQVLLESEAESDIESGRLRKFGNAKAAIAHLTRLQSAK